MPFTLSRMLIAMVVAACALTALAVAGGVAQSFRKETENTARAMTAGDPARAPALIRRYGCAGCHTIYGIPGGDGQVGSSLAGLRQRVYIAGVVTNSPDNLIRWIVTPQVFSPRTAMPATGISEAEARDVAAYLYAQ
ncbi:c-type cytochrome (plasmid) [Bradyrhizobium barranii]|uniref:c-type cytochrome n=1 Tax=Bradyrhizobium TaxID=374 RepID=UPI003488CEE2